MIDRYRVMKEDTPRRNVTPGCVFQHEGRSHQTSVLSARAMRAISFSRPTKERFAAGVRIKASATQLIPTMTASLKNQLSHLVERGTLGTLGTRVGCANSSERHV